MRRLLRTAATDVVGLSGTGAGEKDPGLLLALARFGGAPCVVLGQDRRGQSLSAPLGPAALREARRGMHLAEELRLPLVTLIDTPGAALSPRGRGGRAGRGDRPLPAGPGDAEGADARGAARPGHRRRRARAGPGRPGAGRGQRLAGSAAAGGRLSAIVHRDGRPRRRDGAGTRACGPPTSGGPGSSTGWCPSDRTPPTSRPSSACGSGACSARSWPGCSGRDDTERFRSRLHRYRHLGR